MEKPKETRMLGSFAWRASRLGAALIARSGIRRTAVGRACLGRLNRWATQGLALVLSRHSRPFLVHGHRMYLSNSRAPSLMFTMAMMLDHYETETTRLFERLLKSGMTVIDVGAHVGYYALLAARLVGSHGKVFAFEPDPANCQLLQKNVCLNYYESISIWPSAVAEHSGRSRLLLDFRGNDRNALIQDMEGTDGVEVEGSIEVETISLDDFLQETRVERVDLLKIDAEGAEGAILRGMSRALTHGVVQRIILEFCPLACEQDGIRPEGFLRQLVGSGFAIYRIGQTGDTTWVSEKQFGWLIEDARKRGSANLFVAYPEAS